MRTSLLITGLAIYTGGLGVIGYITASGLGVGAPKIVKKSVRANSVWHHRYPAGYRHGK